MNTFFEFLRAFFSIEVGVIVALATGAITIIGYSGEERDDGIPISVAPVIMVQ